MGCQCVYLYIPRRVVSGATWATTHTRSIVPREYVVEERKTYSHSMVRHGTRIGAAYSCALCSSPTEDSEDLGSVYRKVEGGASRMKGIHHIHTCTWYVRISYYMRGWLTLRTWNHTILFDSIGDMGRIFYTVPVVIKSRTNTAYTTPQKRRHEIRTGVARVRRICSLSRKRPTREVENTGRGCLCDGCHIKHRIREAVPAKNITIRKCEPK